MRLSNTLPERISSPFPRFLECSCSSWILLEMLFWAGWGRVFTDVDRTTKGSCQACRRERANDKRSDSCRGMEKNSNIVQVMDMKKTTTCRHSLISGALALYRWESGEKRCGTWRGEALSSGQPGESVSPGEDTAHNHSF